MQSIMLQSLVIYFLLPLNVSFFQCNSFGGLSSAVTQPTGETWLLFTIAAAHSQ